MLQEGSCMANRMEVNIYIYIYNYTGRWFDRFVLLIILLNTITLAVYDYSDRDNKSLRNQILEIAGLVFTCLFITECICKVSAMGFIMHKNAYLRDGWNVLDFIVVLAGYVGWRCIYMLYIYICVVVYILYIYIYIE